MKAWVALLLTTGALVAAFPVATAHYCSSSTYCGPCTEGEEHAHSDPVNSCYSHEEPAQSTSGGGGADVDLDAGNGRASARANYSPGSGALGAISALAIVALAIAVRRQE
jgi:hypothetical protein